MNALKNLALEEEFKTEAIAAAATAKTAYNTQEDVNQALLYIEGCKKITDTTTYDTKAKEEAQY